MFLKSTFNFLARSILFASVLFMSACASHAPNKPDNIPSGDYAALKAYMRSYIQDQMDDQDIVGLSVALVDDQTIIWQQGFGYADKKNKVRASPKTIYRAGSVSKLFNAIATMQLSEQGKMDIDAPLKQYLPDFKMRSRFSNTDSITPRMILTHHSGLPGDWYADLAGESFVPFTDLAQNIQQQYVAYPPNTILSYSNLGVSLLGDALQKVTGKAYAQLLQERVLNPMGMKKSQFARAIGGELASKAYSDDDEIRETPLRDVPAGGLNTSVEELARLAMMVNQGGEIDGNRILKKATLTEMFEQQNKHIELDQIGMKIGLGWFIDDAALAGQEPVYGHGGSTVAHNAHFVVAPESKLGVVLLSNTESAEPRKIANHILQRAWTFKTGKPFHEVSLPDHKENNDLSGTYAGILGKLEIKPISDDKFKVETRNKTLVLTRHKDGRYYAKYKLFGLLPISVGSLSKVGFYADQISGHELLIGETASMKAIIGERLKPSPINSAWLARLGKYELLNPLPKPVLNIEIFEIKQENGFLIAVLHEAGDPFVQILKTINENEALIEGLGRDMRETLLIQDSDEGEVIDYNGFKFKRIE